MGFLQKTIRLCKKLTDKPLLIYLDSGNDSNDNVAVMINQGCYFIIKKNLRRESKNGWLEMHKQYCHNVMRPKDGKVTYVDNDWKTDSRKQFSQKFTLRSEYEITERTIFKYGQILLVLDKGEG